MALSVEVLPFGMAVIRDATDADLSAVTALSNALIDTTTTTWTERHETVDERRAWLRKQESAGYPLLVAEDSAGDLVGFATFGDFRDITKWPGYRFVVEHTVHVRGDQQGTGVGRALMEELFDRARRLGKTQMIAGIDGTNEGSIRFHERLGFVEVARMPSIGFKHNTWLDLVLMQRALVD